MRLRHAASAAVLACALPALAACGGSASGLNAGDLVNARQAAQFSNEKQTGIALPTGRLEVHTGQPVKALTSEDTSELTSETAPAGMEFVPITWEFVRRSSTAYAGFIGANDLATADIRVGKDNYRLPAPDPSQGAESFYVVVPASSAHVRLGIGYDGVTQVADLTTGKVDAGRAEGLYHLSYKKPRYADCGAKPSWKVLAASQSTCKVTEPVVLPYAGGKWAKPGHEWLVVSVATTFGTLTEAGVTIAQGGTYYPVGLTTTYRLGKAAPVKTLLKSNDDAVCPVPKTGACNSSASLIFDRVGHSLTLTLTQKYRFQLGSGWGGFAGKKIDHQTGTTVITLKKPR
ncbi:hypothetical protein [Nocardioides montaniterrae]